MDEQDLIYRLRVFPATLILIGLIISFILGLFFVTLVSTDKNE